MSKQYSRGKNDTKFYFTLILTFEMSKLCHQSILYILNS